MSDPRTFGQVVRQARLAKGMSMGQLATSVERSTASVRRWERDEGVPAKEVIGQLATVLSLDEADLALIGAEPVPPAPPPPVAPPRSPAQGPSQPTQMGASRVTGVVPVTEPEPTGVKGWISTLYDPGNPWLGYLRAALTVVILLILAWLLVWALAGLFESVGEMWDSMWAEEV